MEEGDLVLFDNRRVLHARRAFRDWTDAEKEERGITIPEGEPSRWLKGCYLDGEVVWDKLVVLNKQVNDL
jgi:gamma-butyrobetaine dioxygenase